VPVAYVGLELDSIEIGMRLLGEVAGIPWSALWTGQAGPAYIARARGAVPALAPLPLHVLTARPQGWPASDLSAVAEAMRRSYPEAEGEPGSRPFLLVVDFLQIIGSEPDSSGRPLDLRERIGRAAYYARDVATRYGAAVLLLSSTARDRYGLLADAAEAAGLVCDTDEDGRPIRRAVLRPDSLIGAAKESGEIEYSADSVSVLVRVPGSRTPEGGCDMLFATAKGRATGATWTPMRFTGHSYREPEDGGAGALELLRAQATARRTARAAKADARDAERRARLVADAAAVATYVLEHPGCSVREARVHAVADSPRRWAPAVALLGAALRLDSAPGGRRPARLGVDRAALPPEVARVSADTVAWTRGHSPPTPPPPSTHAVDGRGPTAWRVDSCGPSTRVHASTRGDWTEPPASEGEP
jgi:hypothetical protein